MPDPTALFKCLADETRLRIALLIAAEGELCVCELMAALDDSQPKISRHLAQLRACGLLLDRRQGQWVYYRLHPQLAAWVQGILQITLEANEAWIKDNCQALREMRRPERKTACD
ncbi:metalloregulator ArsR/SmtB family transcription factor [Pseudomonas sp. 5P_3.1_Bac2]|uniref:metalloregulator ArsR/SmtB family transcription factor n=1 Tax=Pseudomonas sp. 5P_3.1_Bac2 TaxID=2971617 RepID=UPI0021C9A835|nr:metalloregulator ArsR/SmtB family transcription factor [Pseudomonas sp. 5P_3.1_Bac2]MCU1715736.1 metalloregulator ArsR/SmtB family transcription factor [Pseudomonas sp. 5P_3.1_Bac2]